MTPHKHADLIRAWADGAEIEESNFDGEWTSWYEFNGNWTEDEWFRYRIKPQEKKPVKRWLYAYIEEGMWVQGQAFFSDEDIKQVSNRKMVKLLWTETEFDE